MSRVAYQDDSGLKFIIENPDNKMRQIIIEKMQAGWFKEFEEFLEEVRVAIRTMPNGTKILKSKPLEIKIVKNDEAIPGCIKSLEPLPNKKSLKAEANEG